MVVELFPERDTMPIYEYTCGKCGHDFEYLVRGDDTAVCPSCGGRELDKRFSVPAAHSSESLPSCADRQCGQSGCCGGNCQFMGE